MNKLYYTVDDRQFDDYLYIEIDSIDRTMGVEWLAERCAADYDDNSNWESASELEFTLWEKNGDEPSKLGTFTVLREWQPSFSAYAKDQ